MPVRFQVDADFYDHPKSIGMSDAAVALWTRAGSYSAAKLLDGFIAEHVLSALSRTPDEASAELVARGLWRRVRGGFQFHQYGERNLTRADVEATREYERNRKRSQRAQANGSSVPPGHQEGVPDLSRGTPVDVPPQLGSVVSGFELGSGQPPPSPFCPRHPTGTERACGACGRAREAREAWEAARRARLAAIPDCPIHPGSPATNCGGCRSDALVDPAA